jgi:hypothetical protein
LDGLLAEKSVQKIVQALVLLGKDVLRTLLEASSVQVDFERTLAELAKTVENKSDGRIGNMQRPSQSAQLDSHQPLEKAIINFT